jgi:hypothetical protein
VQDRTRAQKLVHCFCNISFRTLTRIQFPGVGTPWKLTYQTMERMIRQS